MLARNEELELERLIEEEARRTASQSLSNFLHSAWRIIEPNNPFVPGFHIDAICEHLEAVDSGEIKKLIINIPPRHAKSTIVSVAFPAWAWGRRAWLKFIYASHAFSLSKRDSILCRSLIQSDWYRQTLKVRWSIATDQNEKMRFDNTERGSRVSTSVGSSVIGQGGDVLVLDDPHSPKSASSDLPRESELDWIDQEFFIRVNDPKTVSKIVIMQRLDQRDATAHLLAQGGWEHLMLPAEYETQRKCMTIIGWSDPREKDGEPLWPARFGKPELDELKVSLGSMGSAGQLQQRPAPAEGNIVQRTWWKLWKELPSDLNSWSLSADLTFKKGKHNDFAVMQIWARRGADKYLIDQLRDKMGFNDQIRALRTLLGKWPQVQAKWVEDAANAAALIETLKAEISGLIAVPVAGRSKVERATAVTPQIEAGNVYLPDPSICTWTNDFIEEWAVFPNGLHDDQVDAASQAISKLTDTQKHDFNFVRLTQTSKFYGR